MSDTNLAAVMTRLDVLEAQLSYLVERQRKQEELVDELVMPVAKEALKSLTATFADAEKKGYFAFGKELLALGRRIVESSSADDVRALGDSITAILDTVRDVTQPEVLQVAREAARVLEHTDDTKPLGLFAAMRATKNEDVGRGLAVMIEVLRRVGQSVSAASRKKGEGTARDTMNALLAPKRRTHKALPPRASVPEPETGAAKVAPVAAAAPRPEPGPVIEGVAVNADGSMVDPSRWTRSLGEKLAALEGVAMTDAHWKVVEFARSDFAERKASPNIRRITQAMGIETKALYALFPKAPARTIAKIAGLPKPAGCL